MISNQSSSDSSAFAELSIRADYTEIRTASTWLARTCLGFSVPAGQIDCLDICLNEALANILEHGGNGVTLNPINLRIQIINDSLSSEASVTISDSGKAFNPLTFEQKDRTHLLESTEPGGLGLTMMKEFVDKLNYLYSNGFNNLIFSVRWDRD